MILGLCRFQATQRLVSQIIYTEGNTRAILQLMSTCNDYILRRHIINTARNATYLSPVAQNALIETTAKVIQRQIVAEVCDAKFFSLLADETTYFSRQDEISVCLRYVSDGTLKVRLLCFASTHDLDHCRWTCCSIATDPGRCWSGLNKRGRTRLRCCRCHVRKGQLRSDTSTVRHMS